MSDASKIIGMYVDAFQQHGRSPASVLCPKGRQALRFDALLSQCDLAGKRLLDFGCGLAHLCDYLDGREIECDYLGVDIVSQFIKSNRSAHPRRRFELIETIDDIAANFDIVVASGVFNIRYLDDPEENQAHVFGLIEKLYARCDVMLSVDFMTSHVDFQRQEAFHLDPANALSFAVRRLSRRVVVDHSYMPFEFCMRVNKSASINRGAGTYE